MAGISMAAASANQASRRLPARIPVKRARQGSASVRGAAHGSRMRGVERLDGISSAAGGNATSDDAQAEIDKLDICEILLNVKTAQPTKMLIYNAVRRSAKCSLLPAKHMSVVHVLTRHIACSAPHTWPQCMAAPP